MLVGWFLCCGSLRKRDSVGGLESKLSIRSWIPFSCPLCGLVGFAAQLPRSRLVRLARCCCRCELKRLPLEGKLSPEKATDEV